MIITKSRTEPLTLESLNALLANFATGLITLEELWAEIDGSVDGVPSLIPDAISNRMSVVDSGAGI